MAFFFLCECLCLVRLTYYSKRSRFKVEPEAVQRVQRFNSSTSEGRIDVHPWNTTLVTCLGYSVVER